MPSSLVSTTLYRTQFCGKCVSLHVRNTQGTLALIRVAVTLMRMQFVTWMSPQATEDSTLFSMLPLPIELFRITEDSHALADPSFASRLLSVIPKKVRSASCQPNTSQKPHGWRAEEVNSKERDQPPRLNPLQQGARCDKRRQVGRSPTSSNFVQPANPQEIKEKETKEHKVPTSMHPKMPFSGCCATSFSLKAAMRSKCAPDTCPFCLGKHFRPSKYLSSQPIGFDWPGHKKNDKYVGLKIEKPPQKFSSRP